MRQVLQCLIVLGSGKPVFYILPDGLNCVEPWRRGEQAQDLHPVVFLQILSHLPMLVLVCVIRYEANPVPLAAHLPEVPHKRRTITHFILPH